MRVTSVNLVTVARTAWWVLQIRHSRLRISV